MHPSSFVFYSVQFNNILFSYGLTKRFSIIFRKKWKRYVITVAVIFDTAHNDFKNNSSKVGFAFVLSRYNTAEPASKDNDDTVYSPY